VNLEKNILGCLDEVGYANKCHSGKIFYKKGKKNVIIRNGDNLPLNGFGFQTEDGNSLIKFQPTSKTFDFIDVLCMIRVCNMESKEIAASLQLLVIEYEKKLEIIRSKKIRKRDIKKADVKKELLKKKTNTFNQIIKKFNNEEITYIIREYEKNGNITDLIDLNNISEEINDEKLLKFEKMKKNKKQSEKSNLYDFVSVLIEQKWIDHFKLEKRIVIALDNAKIHKAKLAKKVAKMLNIKLIFFPKYSSDINPIERVWYSIKDKLSTKYIENETFLKEQFAHYFYIYAKSKTLTENWLKNYIT
jgi:transposase